MLKFQLDFTAGIFIAVLLCLPRLSERFEKGGNNVVVNRNRNGELWHQELARHPLTEKTRDAAAEH